MEATMLQSITHSTSRFSFLLRSLGLALLLLVVGIIVLSPLVAHASAWSSSDKWGTYTSKGYTVANDVWGSGAGPQTIWANSGSNWGVWANHPNTGGIKSYPHSGVTIGKSINSLKSVSSSFNVTVPKSGAYETAYDIWLNGFSYEVMLWMNKTGPIGPLGSYQRNISVGNYNWNVYKGSNGSNAVFSFLYTGSTKAGKVNILAVLKWIENSAKWYGNASLNQVQFGFEISASSGGLNFTSNTFSVSHK
jgi:hypothetical protein